MIITAKPIDIRRRSKRRWHRKTIILRRIIIGGKGTDATARTEFILFGRLWARRSNTLQRWIYAEHRPANAAATTLAIQT